MIHEAIIQWVPGGGYQVYRCADDEPLDPFPFATYFAALEAAEMAGWCVV